MSTNAFGIIDAQRGFMQAEEGLRLGADGFGELAVADGQAIVPHLNRLMSAFVERGYATFTTQDWHPNETAHFSQNPDFVNDWPVHCVANTPGAELHPGIKLSEHTKAFFKGQVKLARGEDDVSYSGYNATTTGYEPLQDWLRWRGVKKLYLGGLALDYCVGKTAIDFRKKLGLDVIVAIDATRSISDESARKMLEQFNDLGIHAAATDQIVEQLESSK